MCDTDDLDLIAEDQRAQFRLAWAPRHRGGGLHDARSLIPGQTPDPRHRHGDPYAEDKKAKDQPDPAHADDVETMATMDVLATSEMTRHRLGELVRGQTT
jgi:hypothetical protein